MKIKKGDTVLIISGKDRARKSKVIEAFPKQGKVVVEGINLRKKHMRPKKSGEKGQIVETPAPLNVSDVKLICSKCGKPTRVGYKMEGKRKCRICKKCKQEI
ncbi:50S ribosomal protein L24 [Patescibacteria group bacterium]|nr:50S ribosomal protein L24 [Patescibacteria group bacterium]